MELAKEVLELRGQMYNFLVYTNIFRWDTGICGAY